MHHILVVDDEPTICEFVQEFLEDEGYRSICVSNGAEAIQHIHGTRPDLVLMDVMMPGLDGRAVVRRLQEHPTYSAIPVILMSAAVRWNEPIDGPIQFISKPFDLDRLLRMISQTISQYQSGASNDSAAPQLRPVNPVPRIGRPRPPNPGSTSESHWASMFGTAASD